MSDEDNGVAVFPFNELQFSDITLRDYFAAKAMQSIYIRVGGSPCIVGDDLGYMAGCAYQMADAMLEARTK